MFNERDPRQHPSHLGQIVMVKLYYVGQNISNHTDHMVVAADLEKFLRATYRLHVNPGINPHNNSHTAKLETLFIEAPAYYGQYWWSNPALEPCENTEEGARILQWVTIATINATPELTEEEMLASLSRQVRYEVASLRHSYNLPRPDVEFVVQPEPLAIGHAL